MATIKEELNVELTAFAIRMAAEFNAIQGLVTLLPMITVNSLQVGQIKGNGLVVGDPLEITDTIVYPEGGQWISAIYLGGDPDDLANPAVWDKSGIT